MKKPFCVCREGSHVRYSRPHSEIGSSKMDKSGCKCTYQHRLFALCCQLKPIYTWISSLCSRSGDRARSTKLKKKIKTKHKNNPYNHNFNRICQVLSSMVHE